MPTPPQDQRAWVLAALDQFELRLLRYALRLLGDESSARDAVQHAFLRLCGESPEQHERPLAPWLFAVVRNRAVDLLRERGRAGALDDDCQCELFHSPEDDPALLAERDDLFSLVRRLLDDLPAAQAEAVVLWSEGFAYAEIAEITQRNEGSLRVLVHRAIAWLKQHPAIEAVMEVRRVSESIPTRSVSEEEEARSASEETRPEGARRDSPGQVSAANAALG